VGTDCKKRIFDLVLTVPAFVLSLPIQGILSIIISAKLGLPVLFRQVRPGLRSQPFELIKFRTMLPADPARGLTDDASRMTEVGRILRSSSLDELPSLWNVIRGDMSLVGPRPLLMEYLTRYSTEQARRHDVRPGLTGLAQVSGRNTLTWEQKLQLDIDYVDNHSLLLDVKILSRTCGAVLSRDGIHADGHVTTSEFMGPEAADH